jgi:hypothetical protein
MNTWQFVDGDIVLSSDDEEQMVMANQWIVGLTQAIRAQVMEEVNGRNELSDGYITKYELAEQPEQPEVPC